MKAHPAAPITPITRIFKSKSHIVAVGVSRPVTIVRHLGYNHMIQETLQKSEPDVLDEFSCQDTQVTLERSPLLLQSGLASMEQNSSCPADHRTTPDLIFLETSNLLKNEGSAPSTWPFRMNDSASLTLRGRPLQRTNRPCNPLERAESRNRLRDATVEVDVQSIKPRYCRSLPFLEFPTDPCVVFEELFVPCLHGPLCNTVSERIARPGWTLKSSVDTPSPTAGVLCTNSQKIYDVSRVSTCLTASSLVESKALDSASTLAAEATSAPMPKFNHAEYVCIKFSNEIRSFTLSSERRPSVMSRLPVEVLSQIYHSLSPNDFNAARHTCRLWFICSLDRTILETMLRRGGWSTSIPGELDYNMSLNQNSRVNDGWLMSKRISRECALGPDWTGNGLCPAIDSLIYLHNKCDWKPNPFVPTFTTDFTEIGVHYPGTDKATSGISFTVSTCGRFLMVAHGCLVYIYELNCNQVSDCVGFNNDTSTLKPVTSVICPRRVLACSMDISSHRYAIAILLDGRMGLVCDLTNLGSQAYIPFSKSYNTSQDPSLSRYKEYRNCVSISSSRSRGVLRSQVEQPFVFPVIAAEASEATSASGSGRSIWEDEPHSQIPPYGMSAADRFQDSGRILFGQPGFQSRAINLFPPPSMPVESSIPTIYSPLCSADDMPRSVAICPQRRCVAFGCSSGIELHWVDALTGQDLSRWFPLTAPSDYLYFLPPRPSVDSAKKLRLISSAGRPGENSAIAQRYGASRSRNQDSPFWDSKSSMQEGTPADVASASRAGLSSLSRDNSDHYRAVPLSDGYHVLFTDPSTGLLCLGSDAPIGGPTKLLRKFWFAGPQGQGSPVAYTAGSDLRWGVRVLAAYGPNAEQGIWLFSVPPDVFAKSLAEHGNIIPRYEGTAYETEHANRDWIPWWKKPGPASLLQPAYGASHTMITRHDRCWPLQVRGQEIGQSHGVVDLAIDAGSEMTIWAFGKDGFAKTWKIDVGRLDTIPERKILVMPDGTIRTSDASGDIEMVDGLSPPDEPSSPAIGSTRQEMYDGSSSLDEAEILQLTHKIWDGQVCGTGNLNDFCGLDADGDVLMTDLPLPSPKSLICENWPAGLGQDDRGELALHAVPMYGSDAAAGYIEREGVDGRDLIDALTGITRIEVEIR